MRRPLLLGALAGALAVSVAPVVLHQRARRAGERELVRLGAPEGTTLAQVEEVTALQRRVIARLDAALSCERGGPGWSELIELAVAAVREADDPLADPDGTLAALRQADGILAQAERLGGQPPTA